MNILAWVVFGLTAGTIANMLDPRESAGGILGSIVLGVVGSLVGGLLANMLFGLDITGFNLSSFVIAVLGSLLLLYIGRAFRRGNV